ETDIHNKKNKSFMRLTLNPRSLVYLHQEYSAELLQGVNPSMKRTRHSIGASRGSKRGNKEKTEANEHCAYFDNLPSHLIAHILLQLNIKYIPIVRCVCKNWKTLISEPHFARLHFERARTGFMIRTNDRRRVSRTLYLLDCASDKFETGNNVKLEPMFKLPLRDAKSFREKSYEMGYKSKRPFRAAARLVLEKKNKYGNRGAQSLYIACNRGHDKFNIVNSCNGLLCLCPPSAQNQNPLVVCNPVIGEFVRLPESTTAGIRRTRVTVEGNVGFGFQPGTSEYKVIKIWVRRVRHADEWLFERVILEVHTLGTPSWRNVEVDPRIRISRLDHPTCMNGALHWIRFDLLHMSILLFNFQSEMLETFPSPPGVFENNNGILLDKEHIRMGELRGFLYICDASSSLQGVSLWIMNKYGIGESWAKIYNIEAFGSPDLSPHYAFCWPIYVHLEDEQTQKRRNSRETYAQCTK
ncbi:hypothetical protein RYX36_003877, partial [Vicia faba]